MSTSNNMYRVGDYVYVDMGPNEPFGVRRIDELQKSASGSVEAEVMIYYRRVDLPPDALTVADENLAEHWDEASKRFAAQVLERELFLAKKTETVSANQIRGKCAVSLLHKAESMFSYIKSEDTFFYTLVYDSANKSLFEDRGEIKIGSQYQAEVPSDVIAPRDDKRKLEELEELCWSPHHSLADKQIDQFLVLARSVGTFARAVDEPSSLKQPSLHMSAAAASRDITLFNAMDLLHIHKYNFAKAAQALVDGGSPRLATDQMEEWTSTESALFEEAMEKYGKSFNDIWTDFLPWKSVKNLVEYYYMWKTTDRYVQQKRVKAVESEQKLKQVYVPDYAKIGDGSIPGHNVHGAICLCCRTTHAPSWYDMPGAQFLGPAMAHCKICQTCWLAYRKYTAMTPGGMNRDVSNYSSSSKSSTGSKSATPAATAAGQAKKATTLFLVSSLMARISRKMPRSKHMNIKRLGRKPFRPVDQDAVRKDCCKLVADQPPAKLKNLLIRRAYTARKTLAEVTVQCGFKDKSRPAWLIPTPKDQLPKPAKEAFPVKASLAAGSRSARSGRGGSGSGSSAPPSMNRIKVAAADRRNIRNNGGVEVKSAPEDIFFRPTETVVTKRKTFTQKDIRKLARRPCRAAV